MSIEQFNKKLKKYKPDFIGVGPPKTATTWLHYVMKEHPNIVTPRVKEIKYFWEIEEFGTPSVFKKLFSQHWHFKDMRLATTSNIYSDLKSILSKKGRQNLIWDLHYFFGKHNDQWYIKLFDTDEISGDVSPKNVEISEKSIKRISEKWPHLKILISLRDPIEREWSRAKMNLMRKKGRMELSEVSENEFFQHFREHKQNKANDYADLIQKWRKYFREDQIFIFFMEEVINDSKQLFDSISDFLEVPRVDLNNVLNKSFNKGKKIEIPSSYLNELIRLNLGYIKDFANYYNESDIPKNWLMKYDSAQ